MAMNHRLLRPRASGGGFDPRAISGLRLWFDGADRSTMFDATSGGSLVADGAAVGRWEDKSGFGDHATQGTANNRPTATANAYSGRSALSFNGTSHDIRSSFNPSTSLGSFFTIAAVFARSSGGNSFPIIFGTNGNANAGRALYLAGNNGFKISYGQNGSGVLGTQNAEINIRYGAIIRFNNSAVSISVNNQSAGSGTPAVVVDPNDTTWPIGDGNSGNQYSGFVYEAMLFTRAITAAEVSALFTAYLMPKWGLV